MGGNRVATREAMMGERRSLLCVAAAVVDLNGAEKIGVLSKNTVIAAAERSKGFSYASNGSWSYMVVSLNGLVSHQAPVPYLLFVTSQVVHRFR